MARLLPLETNLSELPSEAERVTVTALLDALDDSWWVTTGVRVKHRGEDIEIDVVAASPTRGAVIGEVKGGSLEVINGVWYQNGRRCDKSPLEQVIAAKHALVRRLKTLGINHGLWLEHMLIFPDVHNVPDAGIGVAIPRKQILDGSLLGFAQHAFDNLLRERNPVPTEQFDAFMSALKPTISLGGREGRASPAALNLLDRITVARLDALRALGDKQEVLVTGGPGTGKTWLVVDWARRAVGRGDRTVVVCFNRPITDRLSTALADTGVLVSTYHELIMEHLLPQLKLEPPAKDTSDWWNSVPTTTLLEHANEIRQHFDTIIIDEGQDLRPDWLGSLRLALDPAGPKRILITADPAQAIYADPDKIFDGSIRHEHPLERNLRTTRNIAIALVHLGRSLAVNFKGPRSIPSPLDDAPNGPKVNYLLAAGAREANKRVRRWVQELVDHFGVPHSEILVLTTRTNERGLLLDGSDEQVSFVRWEDAEEGSVICETAHRAKGLESTAVIVVAVDDDPDEQLLYVAASRAIWSLTLVGPRSLPARFGVTPLA